MWSEACARPCPCIGRDDPHSWLSPKTVSLHSSTEVINWRSTEVINWRPADLVWAADRVYLIELFSLITTAVSIETLFSNKKSGLFLRTWDIWPHRCPALCGHYFQGQLSPCCPLAWVPGFPPRQPPSFSSPAWHGSWDPFPKSVFLLMVKPETWLKKCRHGNSESPPHPSPLSSFRFLWARNSWASRRGGDVGPHSASTVECAPSPPPTTIAFSRLKIPGRLGLISHSVSGTYFLLQVITGSRSPAIPGLEGGAVFPESPGVLRHQVPSVAFPYAPL